MLRVSLAHPRSRGENRLRRHRTRPWLGSSPLTRGKRSTRCSRGRQRGLIPAHAGKTTHHRHELSRAQAHPRSRGENHPAPRGPRTPVGSSPLTRGKRPRRQYCPATSRLIPAHAGKTLRMSQYVLDRRAHPRSRGENQERPDDIDRPRGSSPLTRGKPRLQLSELLFAGLIPAHAGKTWSRWLAVSHKTAHPRSRGENVPASWDDPLACGSSPLTRGKLLSHKRKDAKERLIPAHAGKTPHSRAAGERPAAHPRSRGENPLSSR